jgi:hypothetical protein
MPDLGPCGHGSCTAEAVAFISRTLGRSARLTVITGPAAAALADGPATADATRTVCHEHAAATLDDLLREAAARPAPDHPQEGS